MLTAFFLAYTARLASGGTLITAHYMDLLPCLPLFLFLYAALGLYPGILRAPHEELKRLSIATSTGFLFLSLFFFLWQQGTMYSRSIILVSWALCLGTAPLFRFCSRHLFAKKAWWGYSVLLFAPQDKMEEVEREFLNRPEQGLRITQRVPFVDGFYGQSPSERALPAERAKLCLDREKERTEQTLRALHEAHPKAIAFIIADALAPEIRQTLIMVMGKYFRRVIVQVDDSWIKQSTLQVADAPCGLALTMCQNLLDPTRMRMKRLLDIVLCTLGSVILVPIIPLLALCIRLDSKGPVFFTQKRLGQNGRTIHVYKFRTMAVNAEEVLTNVLANDAELRAEWARDQKLSRDPRLTRVGAFLRHTSLDELPQIFNVLKNEMSLVGPRPIVEDEINRYGAAYDLYLRVKPGMTGLWQVSGRNELPYAKRVELDQHYVYNWSVWLDIYLILQTVPAMLSRRGAY